MFDYACVNHDTCHDQSLTRILTSLKELDRDSQIKVESVFLNRNIMFFYVKSTLLKESYTIGARYPDVNQTRRKLKITRDYRRRIRLD